MATQVTALPQTHGGHAEALQQIFDICDDVSARLNTPDQHLPVEVPSSILPDSALFEVLKARLESMTGMRFTLYTSGAEGTWFFPAAAPMSSEPPANSVDNAVGLTGGAQSLSASTPGTGDVASTNKKIPRPMNAFMIYRLRHHSIVAGENPGMHNNDICAYSTL
ncbi:uncharacterized protein SEPMUDRAFT_152382 [Sphaerulina musiva SO2202]|uniref:HMG box domain-containing protein n=1 Tax=Sphaerulina musiva (strain SO2202) TaxID=692275 RepID=M3CWP9_SPHMS|nr:uncharacterized protein SEPMUDRAFT_152382 [Sphaerulina musiva SO2202]EMF08096.1 hypothetical protein SEPMUDRAFT_152382 [Sphaerulina musiva SO2202]